MGHNFSLSLSYRTLDPQVTLPSGGKGSLFDSLEDTDASECTKRARATVRANIDSLYQQASHQPFHHTQIFNSPSSFLSKLDSLRRHLNRYF